MILGFIIFVLSSLFFISIASKANKEKQEKKLAEEKRRADFEEETLKKVKEIVDRGQLMWYNKI